MTDTHARTSAPVEFVEFADFDRLHEYLLDLNERGIIPDVSGYDRVNQPVIAWLTEVGGDETWPLAITLGGQNAEAPEAIATDMGELAYPIRIAERPE